VNQEFVRSKDRDGVKLKEDDAVEIVTPRQGG
ncbi:MAG: MoaD/ThiS family protein, partial [Methylocystis sp.]